MKKQTSLPSRALWARTAQVVLSTPPEVAMAALEPPTYSLICLTFFSTKADGLKVIEVILVAPRRDTLQQT
jgi:hypothetical protein